jgi:hypothetical protein
MRPRTGWVLLAAGARVAIMITSTDYIETQTGGAIMRLWSAGVLLGALSLYLLANVGEVSAENPGTDKETLHLTAGQTEVLSLEPMLVTVRLQSKQMEGLPAAPGESKLDKLSFEIEPAVKARPGAKALPLEAQATGSHISSRLYDLSECFLFPDKGTWKVRAVVEHNGTTLRSETVSVTIRKPGKDDKEQQPVARIHHTPWSNYETNAFCGDTFDTVKRWPDSRLAKYCHYWNGRHLQHKKDYAKAEASYRIVVEKYPDFALADHAAYGVVECLCAQKKFAEAQKANTELRKRLEKRAAGQSAVQQLAQDLSKRIASELARVE